MSIYLSRNWSPAIGSGERCLPGDVGECGDGGKAELAKLSYPKGSFLTKFNPCKLKFLMGNSRVFFSSILVLSCDIVFPIVSAIAVWKEISCSCVR